MSHTPTFQDANYRPSGVSNGYQEFNLFLPDTAVFTKPSAGWPVVVFVNNAGYTASTRLTTAAGVHELMLHAGFAVCDATVTITDTGDPSITGGGMFWDPTDTNWATDDVPEKDVASIVQHLRDKAAAYGIDPNAITLAAQTYAASQLALWVTLAEDLADSGASTTQEQQSSVPNACLVVTPLTYFEALLYSRTNNHLRDEATPSAKAATYGDASFAHRLQASPLYRTFLNQTGGQVHTFMWAVGTPSVSNLNVDLATGAPEVSNTINSETDAWFTQMLTKYMRYHISGSHIFHRHKLVSTTATLSQLTNHDRYVDALRLVPVAVQFFQAATAGWKSSVATFDLPYDWAVPMSTTRAAVQAEGATTQRRQTHSSYSRSRVARSERHWEIGAQQATGDELTSLKALWSATSGQARTIDFEPPGVSGVVPCFFADGSLEYELVAHNLYSWRARLVEAV